MHNTINLQIQEINLQYPNKILTNYLMSIMEEGLIHLSAEYYNNYLYLFRSNFG